MLLLVSSIRTRYSAEIVNNASTPGSNKEAIYIITSTIRLLEPDTKYWILKIKIWNCLRCTSYKLKERYLRYRNNS
jgi:hypothetical protein